MESQNKDSGAMIEGAVVGKGDSQRVGGKSELFLRVLALVLTMAAAILLGVNKQSKLIPVKLVDTLPPIYVPAFAKWHYLSAFVYLVVTNVIGCSYAALSLLLSLMVAKKRSSPTLIVIMILDILMVALLFSSNGAAGAIGLMGLQGNSHVRWNKVCNVFGKFCNQVAAALFSSLLGAIVFLLLVVVSALRLHRKSFN